MEEHIMKKNLWILGGVLAMAFTACTNDDVLPADNTLASGKKVQVTAYAPGDGADSRIAFNDNEGTFSLSWNTEESFSVIRGGANQTFSNGESGGNIFEGDLPTAGEGTYYAVYPANADAADHTAVPYDLSVQTGAMNSNSTYMYASSETTGDATSFQFQHATAVLKATFSGLPDDVEIKQVVVTTAVNKVDGTIDLTNGTMTPGSKNSISINFGENPVQKNAAVYIYLPPMEAAQKTLTFHVEVNDDNWYSATLPGTNGKDIVPGMLYTVDVQEVLPNCLIFEAEEDGQYLIIRSGSMWPEEEEETNLQYSTDCKNWTDLDYKTQVSFVDKKLFLRGTAENGTNGARIEFDNNKTVSCRGDIRTLMNYNTYSDIQASGNFQSLFSDCRSLTTAPALPATTLTSRCYESMFSGCTSLNAAPKLPATTLASNCYSGMFSGCTSLNAAPALNATTLAYSCYSGMFSGCTSLTTAPELNAENLDYMCYYFMFKDCTALTSAPALLPATTLTSQCYESMFKGCTLLTTAPELNATILAERCYFGMFSDCTSLITAPELPATTLAGECYRNMFSGCTSLITVPELSATNLEGNCYRNMFSGCISLTTAPALNATTLADYCYCEMFSGCTNLSSVTMLATDISADNCLKNWLEGAGTNASTRTIRVANGEMIDPVNVVTPDNWSIQNYM